MWFSLLICLPLAAAQPRAHLNNDTVTGGLRVLVNLFPECTDAEIIGRLQTTIGGRLPDSERVRRLLQQVRLSNHFGSLSPMQLPDSGPSVPYTLADYNERLDAAHTFLNRHESDNSFLERIIAIDENVYNRDQHFVGAYHMRRIIRYALPPPGTAFNSNSFTAFLASLIEPLQRMGFNWDNPPILLLDNVPFHATQQVRNFAEQQGWEIIYNPRRSGSDFMPWDIDAFDLITRFATPHCHRDNQELRRAIESAVNSINERNMLTAIEEMPARWRFIINNNGRRTPFPRRGKRSVHSSTLNFTAPCIRNTEFAEGVCKGEQTTRRYGCREGKCFTACTNDNQTACTTANTYAPFKPSFCYVHNDCNPCWKCITNCDLLFID